MTTIFTDSPERSKNLEVEFAACTDPAGKNYDIVIIEDQIWMEENLAYLPDVSLASEGSDSIAHYYVYGYEGNTAFGAKEAENYNKYGVLYNWQAAIISCPNGWHLPSYSEWTILTDYLILNGHGYGEDRYAIAKSIASTSKWSTSSQGPGSVGNNQSSNNSSGFNAFPAGYLYRIGLFQSIGWGTKIWSSTSFNAEESWNISLGRGSFNVHLRHTNNERGYSVRCIKDE